MIGQTVSHYRVLEKLGRGSMGEVFRGEDLKLGRSVALKFLSPQFGAEAEHKRRFIREARAASALDHPNICTIYEIEELANGQLFIAMACYGGRSLKERMKQAPLPLREAISLVTQVAQGLAKAHEHDIVHRDIKPENLMFSDDGVVKIVDFGLAKLNDTLHLTKSGATMGTPAYMSPEQIRNSGVDCRSDVWSLSVVFYQMITGHLPFQGADTVSMLYAIVNDAPTPIERHLPHAPPVLLQLLARGLVKDASQRYQTATAMVTDLQSLEHSLTETSETIPAERRHHQALDTIGGVAKPSPPVLVLSEATWQAVQNGEQSHLKQLQSLAQEAVARDEIDEPEISGNPYVNRLTIKNPRNFYGRESELTRIYERIKAVRPQSLSIVGERRIGKSSLLWMIYHPDTRRKYLPNPAEYIFIYMDLQAQRKLALREFFQVLYDAIQQELGGQLRIELSPDYNGMQRIVHFMQSAHLKLILLWDEFESITRNQQIGVEFYGYFRSLANNFNVAYLTSSCGQLQSLCHTKAISDSPFFNIFTNQRLSGFRPEEAAQLIAEPSARADKPLARHQDFVVDIAGYFPFFIQIACSALFELAGDDRIDYKKAKEIFMNEARPHFQEYWERFDDSQQATVAALAKSKQPPREHAFALKELSQAGFLKNGTLFSSLFAEFVLELERKEKPWWRRW